MNTPIKMMILAMFLTALAAPLALAEVGQDDKPLVTVSPYLGWGLYDQYLDLDDYSIFGARAAIHPLRWLAVEGTWGRSSSINTTDLDVDLDHYGVDLMALLAPSRQVVPYLTAGWAQFDYDREDWGVTVPLNGGSVGVGVIAKLGGDNANYRALRLDLRDVITDEIYGEDGTPGTAHNLIGSVGITFGFGKSSKDTDGDGVRDRDDACPDTPLGAVVDGTGCPSDSDGDGVYDGLDQCAGTPAGAMVDVHGCPSDSDGDGVLDGLDRCADTPAGAKVDAHGCPLDSDGDGVFDGLDKCPDTDTKLQVDVEGCPIAVTETEIQLLDTGTITTNQIAFATSSAELDMANSAILQEIGETLSRWPDLKIEIGGHTDSSGSAAFNQKLSQQRAQSVLDYLLTNYPEIDSGQFTVVGYGEENPIADNDTPEGKAANRRVEFKVLNTEQLKKVIEQRKMLER